MRILALGGAGAMGAAAVRAAVALPGVREVVVADRDLAAAGRLAGELRLGGAALSAQQVDVTDAGQLDRAIGAADVVLNTVGPYYRFGPAVLAAAIRARTHYLDLCDDWEPTVRMLELDGEARRSGVTAVLGMGASPGVSNLLAALAAERLDTVHDLYTAWPVDVPDTGEELTGPDGRAGAAAVHWMEQISGTVAVVERGRLVQRRPLRPVTLALPGGRAGTAYTVGHPEPVTLHRSLAPTGNAACLMVVTRGTVAFLDGLRRDLDRGRLDNESAATLLAGPPLGRTLTAGVRAAGLRGPGGLPPFFAAATGLRDGRPLGVLARPAEDPPRLLADMALATGVPLALGLAQLLDGTARRPGVHPPEAVVDAARFFRDLEPWSPGGVVVEEVAGER
ncbi:saccharopine dehydrogenase family protein [Kitasatospora sp. NPDC056181]|uniref:saccharopine dehydrogenase family protein n=1 Tax=Kitasatospora sp. NPDC056181 TaxID=3345737 RepID=UPI0035DE7CE7